MAADGKKTLACAVYTRKSSEEGLEQEFNSLDAQREACEAFILSQRHEGWRLIETHYDDGGFSGGNMERPALATLMADIQAKRIDVVVVYKVDRLTRSLADFAKIVEVFDAQGVSFVSVTQQFNTTTSMGRLTLNVLLSFAQFEREVTGERIRDKIAASKKKGMFMGGGYPLGYDLVDHKLVVNETEAETVRTLFTLYTELRCVRRLQAEAVRRGILSKLRISESGRQSGGTSLARGHLYYILRNRTYLGEIVHNGRIHEGQHKPIVSRELWDEVQGILAANARKRSAGDHAQESSPLAGLLFDDRGNRLTPSHTSKSGVRYRYYVCQALLQNRSDKAGALKRVPAEEIEELVLKQVGELFEHPNRLIDHLGVSDGEEKHRLIQAAAVLATKMKQDGDKALLAFARRIVKRIVAGPDKVKIDISTAALRIELGTTNRDAGLGSAETCGAQDDSEFSVTVPVRLTRSGRQKSMIAMDKDNSYRLVNDNMLIAIARAMKWDQEMRSGAALAALAKRDGLSTGYATSIMPLAFLAPDIVRTIHEGRQPEGLTIKALVAQLPIDWSEQRRVLGIPALAR